MCQYAEFKGSQLPEMQKYIPDMPLSLKLDFRSKWSVSLSVQLYLRGDNCMLLAHRP